MLSKISLKQRVGEILVEQEIISRDQLDRAFSIMEMEPEVIRRRISQVLCDDVGADRHKVMKAIADFYAFREIGSMTDLGNIERLNEIKRVLGDLPNDKVSKFINRKALPYKYERGMLVIGAADPTDPEILVLANQLNVKSYEVAYMRLDVFEAITASVYEKKNEFLDLLEDIEFEAGNIAQEEEGVDEAEIDAEINQSMLNSLLEGMLVEAVRQGVSDIHIIPGVGNTTDIYFRQDGKLGLWHSQTGVKSEALSAVVKDKTRNVDRFVRDMSQDGFIQRRIDEHQLRFRVSIMPIVGQEYERKLESIVIRILDDRKVITDLNQLGLQNQAKADFIKAIHLPQGMIIITGPTGSGKSTTLVAALYTVITPQVNVLTVEEPVEYLIKGARQLKISEKMSFDEAMRGILRHDPDIVLVGEIRDLKTAEIAIKLANTGHLTFSTLHTNDAPSAVSRLFKMGVEPFLIASAINLVMAQRLVRKLCNSCKQEITDLDPAIPRAIGFTEEEIATTKFYKAVGCNKCRNGYKGRIAVMEALFFDKKIKHAIFNAGDNVDEDQIRDIAVSNGMLTMRASGRERIKEGQTTIEEVIAITIDA
jgi:type IV pilus assembly protein PilB